MTIILLIAVLAAAGMSGIRRPDPTTGARRRVPTPTAVGRWLGTGLADTIRTPRPATLTPHAHPRTQQRAGSVRSVRTPPARTVRPIHIPTSGPLTAGLILARAGIACGDMNPASYQVWREQTHDLAAALAVVADGISDWADNVAAERVDDRVVAHLHITADMLGAAAPEALRAAITAADRLYEMHIVAAQAPVSQPDQGRSWFDDADA